MQNETYVMRKEEVDALVETQNLSRKAIFMRLKGNNPDKKDGKDKKPKKKSENPGNVDEKEYKSIEINDEDDSI